MLFRTLTIGLIVLTTGAPVSAQFSEDDFKDLRQRLARPVSVNLRNVPLTAARDWIARESGLNCVIDQRDLDDLNLREDEPVSLTAQDIPLQTAMELLLEQLDLTWSARPGALIITADDGASTQLVVRVYSVADLTGDEIDPNDYWGFNSLIDMLISNVQPDTWAENGGGEADIRPLEKPRVLVVSQTVAIQFEIEDLLTRLRDVHDNQGLGAKRSSTRNPPRQRFVPRKRYVDPAFGVPAMVHE